MKIPSLRIFQGFSGRKALFGQRIYAGKSPSMQAMPLVFLINKILPGE
jgi:hypothetical protein